MDFPVYLHDISSKNPGLIDSGALKEKLSIFSQILFFPPFYACKGEQFPLPASADKMYLL